MKAELPFWSNISAYRGSEAEKRIRAREKEHAAIATRLFGANLDDVSLYHLVLNTSRIPFTWTQEITHDLVARFLKGEAGASLPLSG